MAALKKNPKQNTLQGHIVVTRAAVHCLVAHEWSHNNKYYRTVMGTDVQTALSGQARFCSNLFYRNSVSFVEGEFFQSSLMGFHGNHV